MGLMIDFFILLLSAAGNNAIVKPIQMARDNNNCHICVPPSFLKTKHYCSPPTPHTSHSFLIFSQFLKRSHSLQKNTIAMGLSSLSVMDCKGWVKGSSELSSGIQNQVDLVESSPL